MRKLTAISLCALLIFTGTFIVANENTRGQQLAPDFTLPVVGGGTLTLSDLRGKVVVLDFMATWCGPCVTEIGHLKEVDGAYSDSEVRIISVDVDSSESDSLLSDFASQHGITWTVVRDTSYVNNELGYDVSSIPTLVIVDQDGYIQHRHVGVTSASVLASEIDALLDSGSGNGDTGGEEDWSEIMAAPTMSIGISETNGIGMTVDVWQGVKFTDDNGDTYKIILTSVSSSSITVIVALNEWGSDVQNITINVGYSGLVDTDGNGKDDLSITCNSASQTAGTAFLDFIRVAESTDGGGLPGFGLWTVLLATMIALVFIMKFKRPF